MYLSTFFGWPYAGGATYRGLGSQSTPHMMRWGRDPEGLRFAREATRAMAVSFLERNALFDSDIDIFFVRHYLVRVVVHVEIGGSVDVERIEERTDQNMLGTQGRSFRPWVDARLRVDHASQAPGIKQHAACKLTASAVVQAAQTRIP